MHVPESSSSSKDFSDVEGKLLEVERLRESGVRKPAPRPSLEVELEGESNMERGNNLLLQMIFRPQNGCQAESWGGDKGDQGKQRWEGAGGVLTKRAASAIQQAGKNDGDRPQIPFSNVGHRRRRRG